MTNAEQRRINAWIEWATVHANLGHPATDAELRAAVFNRLTALRDDEDERAAAIPGAVVAICRNGCHRPEHDPDEWCGGPVP